MSGVNSTSGKSFINLHCCTRGNVLISSLVKTPEKKLFNTSALSISFGARLPSGCSSSAIPLLVFSLEFIYAQNDFGLSLASWAMSFSKFFYSLP